MCIFMLTVSRNDCLRFISDQTGDRCTYCVPFKMNVIHDIGFTKIMHFPMFFTVFIDLYQIRINLMVCLHRATAILMVIVSLPSNGLYAISIYIPKCRFCAINIGISIDRFYEMRSDIMNGYLPYFQRFYRIFRILCHICVSD